MIGNNPNRSCNPFGISKLIYINIMAPTNIDVLSIALHHSIKNVSSRTKFATKYNTIESPSITIKLILNIKNNTLYLFILLRFAILYSLIKMKIVTNPVVTINAPVAKNP